MTERDQADLLQVTPDPDPGSAIDAELPPPPEGEELAATHMRAEDVRAAVRAHFGGKGAMVMDEVRNAAGFAANRSCDMMVMETWPSRRLIIRGIEVKVSRRDWLHELNQPEKAEAFHKHCDEWWVAFSPDVLLSAKKNSAEERLAEVPEGWGVLEAVWVSGSKVPKLKILRQPARLDRRLDVISRHLTATMLRAISGARDKATDAFIREEVERRVASRLQDRREARMNLREQDQELGAAIREACGISSAWEAPKLMQAMKVVMALNLAEGWSGLFHLVATVQTAGENVRKTLQMFADEFARNGIPVPDKMGLKLPKSRVKPGGDPGDAPLESGPAGADPGTEADGEGEPEP